VKLTTHLHLVPWLRMRGAIPPLLHTYSWRGAVKRNDYSNLTLYTLHRHKRHVTRSFSCYCETFLDLEWIFSSSPYFTILSFCSVYTPHTNCKEHITSQEEILIVAHLVNKFSIIYVSRRLLLLCLRSDYSPH